MMKFSRFALICVVAGSCMAPAFGQTTPPPASTHKTAPATPAAATSPSGPAAEAFRIVTEDLTKQWWIAAKSNPAPKYPLDAVRDNVQGCIAIAFAIHADGSTTPIQLIKHFWTVYNPGISAQFKQLMIRSVAQWHYAPAPANVSRAPVLTYAVATFTLGPPNASNQQAESDRMKAKCEVTNFAQDMQKLLGSPGNSSDAK